MIRNHLLLAGSLALILTSGAVLASIIPQDISKLGSELTPLGADRQGNADGTIPGWGESTSSEAVSADKPLFEITAANLDQYRDNLSVGQIALFERYPETFRMPVYPSKRTANYPERIYDNTLKAASNAELLNGGNGFKGAYDAYPFPLPENGLEALWNHIVRYRGEYIKRPTVEATVEQSGSYTYARSEDEILFNYNQPDGSEADLENILFYYLSKNDDGSAQLIHETQDQSAEPRLAWGYLPGIRRVRRAPILSYDTPVGGGGLRTADDTDLYNGAPDLYDWTLKGKKEIYIPYNNQQLLKETPEYDDIFIAGHINPDFTRYELHRVWVVEGKLKDDKRHIYSRRTLYLDEDSWGAAVVDQYDGRDQLWKVSIAYLANYEDVPTTWTTWDVFHDLQSRRYHVQGLVNKGNTAIAFPEVMPKKKHFTPASLRRMGRR